jgi:hypothetical protein
VERHEVIELMRELKLLGMRAAYDEVLSNALKRQHAAQDIVGSLLQAAHSDDCSHRFRSKPAGHSDDPSRVAMQGCATLPDRTE